MRPLTVPSRRRPARAPAALALLALLGSCAIPPHAGAAAADGATAADRPARAPQDGPPGGRTRLAPSPVRVADLEDLKRSLLFTDDDVAALRRSRDVLAPQVEAILDVWYGFVGANPHLLAHFSNGAGEPLPEYLAQVRKRFARWILTTADARYDQPWLDLQHEIGLRHHRSKKNRTDGAAAAGASDHIPFSHVVALTIPITTTLRPFLANGGASEAEVDAMQDAWRKAVLLQTILWSHPYVRKGDF